MQWRCPACRLEIHHNEVEVRPRPNTIYRCHACRLELVLDPIHERLTVADLPSDEPPKPTR
jgi:hypothetical protein